MQSVISCWLLGPQISFINVPCIGMRLVWFLFHSSGLIFGMRFLMILNMLCGDADTETANKEQIAEYLRKLISMDMGMLVSIE